MIWNIIDQRKRPYRWKRVNAIIEAIEHENSRVDADRVDEMSPLVVIDYERRDNVSIQEAINWANQARCPVTLYIYDAGDETTDLHFNFTGNRFPNGDSN